MGTSTSCCNKFQKLLSTSTRRCWWCWKSMGCYRRRFYPTSSTSNNKVIWFPRSRTRKKILCWRWWRWWNTFQSIYQEFLFSQTTNLATISKWWRWWNWWRWNWWFIYSITLSTNCSYKSWCSSVS